MVKITVVTETKSNGKLEVSEDPKSVEDILEKIGGFSWFQIFAGLLLILPELPTAMITMSPLLTGSTHLDYGDYTCADMNDGFERNFTKENFCEVLSNCTRLVYSGSSSYTTIVKEVPKILTKIHEWALFCERAWIVQMVTSVQMAGNTVGALIFPRLADKSLLIAISKNARITTGSLVLPLITICWSTICIGKGKWFGRRKIFFGICLLLGISGILAGVAPNVEIFAILRFISGLSMGGLYLVYLNYLMEFLPPNYRTISGCVTFWALGEMLLALLGYLIPGWRELSIAVALPLILVPLFYTWLPESPRWLLCQGRTSEAAAVFNHISKWNGRLEVTYAQVQGVQAEILCNQSPKCVEANSTDQQNESCWSIFSIFKPNPYRRQFLFLICIWFTLNLIYYGVSFNAATLHGDPYLNILFLGISELPGPFSGLFLNNRFGRKKSLLGFLSISAILFTFLMYLQVAPSQIMENQFGHDLLFESTTKFLDFGGRFCIAAAFGILACATAESFPTSHRLTYSGTCGFFGNIGGILAPQIVFLATVWTSAPYIGFSILSVLVVILCIGLKETSDKPLSDSSGNLRLN